MTPPDDSTASAIAFGSGAEPGQTPQPGDANYSLFGGSSGSTNPFTDSSNTSASYVNSVYASDVSQVRENSTSIFDSATNLAVKGVPLVAASIVNSFYNTGVEVANWFGANADKATIQGEVDGLGLPQSYADYYQAHQQGIEATGLLAGSLIPGLGAIKGASAAIKVAWLAKTGLAAGDVTEATGLLGPIKYGLMQAAKQEVANGSGAFGLVNLSKYKAIAAGAADAALQGATFEVATLATMHASPLLDDMNTQQVANDIFYGALTGGGIGGLIEGLGVRSIIKQAEVANDFVNKAQQFTTRFGGYQTAVDPGDRINGILKSLSEMPDATTNAGKRQAAFTLDRAQVAVREQATVLANGDNRIGNAFADGLFQMKAAGASLDDQYNYLARLSEISNVNSDPLAVPGSTFYVNKFAGAGTKLENIATSTPHPNAIVSTSYQLRDTSISPKIATISDQYTDPVTGISRPLYSSAQEAFAAGNDFFVGAKNGIAVNPNAPNIISNVTRPGENRILNQKERISLTKTGNLPDGSAPLTGANLTLNVKTGSIVPVDNITDSAGNIVRQSGAPPVVGDYGPVTTNRNGVQYGDQFSNQLRDSVITADTSPIDANARYVWVDQQGIKGGQQIQSNDIAYLEKLYNDGTKSVPTSNKFVDKQLVTETNATGNAGNVAANNYTNYIKSLTAKGVSLIDEDGENVNFPATPQDLLATIKQQKDALIGDSLSQVDTTKESMSEIAQRANTPVDYIINSAKAGSQLDGRTAASDFMLDTKGHTDVNHVQLSYDIGSRNLGAANDPNHGMILRGLLDSQYRIQQIQDVQRNAATNFFGANADQFKINATASQVGVKSVRPGFASFSAADYNSAEQEAQRLGYQVNHFYKQTRMTNVMSTLQSAANGLRGNSEAAAEAGAFVTVRRATSENYQFLPAELAAKYGRTPDTAVLEDSLVRDPKTNQIVDWDQSYTPNGFISAAAKSQAEQGALPEGLHTYYDLSPEAAAWERGNLALNSDRVGHWNNFRAAQGLNKPLNPNVLYAPPIDTAKYPYIAMVKERAGSALNDGGISYITASSASELQEKMALVSSDFDVYTKDQLAAWKAVQGDFDYNRNFMQSRVNNTMKRQGLLNNSLQPVSDANSLIQEMVNWHSRNELSLTRDYAELMNSQFFAEVKEMSANFTSAGTSKTGPFTNLLTKTIDNPYESFRKVALSLNDKDSFKLWTDGQEKLDAFASRAFSTVRDAFTSASKGTASFEQASAVNERMGLGNPFGKAVDAMKAFGIANRLPGGNDLSRITSTANSILSATTIRLDAMQSLITTMSTPILTLAEAHGASQEMRNLLSINLPGTQTQIPGISKLMFTAVKNWVTNGPEKQTVMDLLRQQGKITDNTNELYHGMIDDLTLPPSAISNQEWLTKLKSATNKASQLTGNQLTETFSRYVAGDVASQIFTAAGYTGQQLTDNIATFVNRVHGSYVASQRPIAFQGPIGQALGLFQTYNINMLQQLFRYVENGQGKTLAILGGLQTSIFGLNGLPGFQMLNNAVGSLYGNSSHSDIYSTTNNLMDHNLASYVLYGVASNVLNSGLYSRGDINPRSLTILPVNPLDFPAVRGGINFISNLIATGQKLASGGNVPASLLLGLEHNGLSRPLSGLAQLVQGFTTTANGNLISNTSDPQGSFAGWNDIYNIANYSRLLGSRPLDEAIAMDNLYRSSVYQATDESRMQTLSSAIKTSLYDHGSINPDHMNDFVQKYTMAGGHIAAFSSYVMRLMQDANVSTANKTFLQMKTPQNQQRQMVMGGVPLPDYTLSPSNFTPSTAGP